MKLRFKHQKFQADAAKAVCDVFTGQPYLTPTYMIDPGITEQQLLPEMAANQFSGWSNQSLVSALNDEVILGNLNKVQRSNLLEPSRTLEGRYNLTVEMETGVGKTYTYIKTMYELYARYGWSKYIVVVPSVAIREGVYKSFQMTEEHFAEEYGKKIRYFIYNSSNLTAIDRFASDSAINVMIINSQAFNARGKDARRIYMKLDEFRSRRPIDILAKTNPIMIIDEPQSVEGAVTKEKLREFNPFITLRYSATHREKYNMVYRLDAMDAYNKRLVKKISVKGISVRGSTATESYLYLERINLSKGNPTATIEFDHKGKAGIRKVSRVVGEGYNIFQNSGELDEYKDGYTVRRIDGRDSSIELLNGIKLFAGDVIGAVNEGHMRRIQIRETILSHIERERKLFTRGIKVLSLFFIDAVARYRQYDEAGQPVPGEYARIFEEEYQQIVGEMQQEFGDEEYMRYLKAIPAEGTHAGYFSIDKRSNRLIDSKLGDRRERTSEDVDAYDLIMKDKERLLDRKEPVRFIFSHSALREGWDNPNVFQICTLKQSSSDVRKRQEVGRGLRLAVNQDGERMDVNVLGEDVHRVNVLTVVANESYDDFSRGLQSEIAAAIGDRPVNVDINLFKGKVIKDAEGTEQTVDATMAQLIYDSLLENGYVKRGKLTEEYYEAKKANTVSLGDDFQGNTDEVVRILDTIFDPSLLQPENDRVNNVVAQLDKSKLGLPEFKKLWEKINSRSIYVVDFNTEELIKNAISSLNRNLKVSRIFVRVESGAMDEIASKEDLLAGGAFKKTGGDIRQTQVQSSSSVKYDLVGKVVSETGLTRAAVVRILQGIRAEVFEQFKNNPEEFILKASDLINQEKATVIIQHITYDKLDAVYDTTIFTEPELKGRLEVNALPVSKHLYDHVIYDSSIERQFAEDLDHSNEVAVYVKLPNGFYINTPVGKYNPDWAIAFHEGSVKHIYFVAETKGSMSTMQLRAIEEANPLCSEHFKAISTGNVVYDVVDNYETLMDKVLK